MPYEPPIELIVYGDFNCPFSALASARATQLERLGRATIDWRAVEHAPDIPPTGHPVTGESGARFRHELEQVRSLLAADEPDQLALPTVQSNTNLATVAYAATPASRRPTVRTRLFAAYWSEDADLADSATLAHLGAPRTDEHTARRWRDEWLTLTEPIVPAMVLPDGYVSRGLGALARLARFAMSADEAASPDASATTTGRAQAADATDLGGESPCFAHLHEEPPD